MSDNIIEIEKLGKKYVIGHQQEGLRYLALRDVLAEGAAALFNGSIGKLLNWSTGQLLNRKQSSSTIPQFPNLTIQQFNNSTKEDFWALKNVSFEVKQGERIGIIGRNGAGKSTLLKVLSRITEPTTGKVKIRGRVASLLEVGTGFHPELTGRENIYLNGAILGMKKSEISRKYDEIVAFAEVEKFLDTPVKRYSSGMYVRLAFAVAAHLEPEILVVDEVLAVGDARFQKKCLGKMEDVSSKEGRTVLFVSHNMAAIRQLCGKCILLQNGEIIATGGTASVTEFYLENTKNLGNLKPEIAFEKDDKREFQMLSVRMLNHLGVVSQCFDSDEFICIEIICFSKKEFIPCYGYLRISAKDGMPVLVSDTFDFQPNVLEAIYPGKFKIVIKIPPRTIGHGEYTLVASFNNTQGSINKKLDVPTNELCSFQISDNTTMRGDERQGVIGTLLKWEASKID